MDCMENKDMLHWISISLIIVFSFAFAFAITDKEKEYIEKNQSTIESVKSKYEGLKMPKDIDVEKYKELEKNKSDIEKYKAFGNVDLKALEGLFKNKNWLDYNLELKSDEKKNLIFYLFSTSVPSQTVKNVFLASKKYKTLEFYGVIRGISKKTWEYLQSLDEKAIEDISIKINPNIFRYAEVKVVPAFVLAECNDRPMGIIRSSSCSFKAVIYGDVSLDFAIEKFKERGLWKE